MSLETSGMKRQVSLFYFQTYTMLHDAFCVEFLMNCLIEFKKIQMTGISFCKYLKLYC